MTKVNQIVKKKPKTKYWPNTDGTTHVNVHHHGKTELGQLLANSTKTPFRHPKHGTFNSMEGFVFWLSIGDKADEKIKAKLRFVFGPQARLVGLELLKEHGQARIENYDEELKTAMRCKIEQTENLAKELRMCDLPFAHYHSYKLSNWKEREVKPGPRAPQIHKGKEHVVVIPKTFGKFLRIIKEIQGELADEPTAMSVALMQAVSVNK